MKQDPINYELMSGMFKAARTYTEVSDSHWYSPVSWGTRHGEHRGYFSGKLLSNNKLKMPRKTIKEILHNLISLKYSTGIN